ncbi:hypothetical protein [Sulfurimonas sp.]
MKSLFFTLATLLFSLSFVGCENRVDTKVSEVHWDRDMCARCAMVVSDRHNTVEVKNPDNGKTYMFDDIGCMILWFDEEAPSWKDRAVIWITDANTGQWIDARKAFYDTQNITPMAYGFSAHKSKQDIKQNQEIIDFNEVVKRVRVRGK